MISLSSSWDFQWNSLSHPVEEGQGESSWMGVSQQPSLFFLSQSFICHFVAVTEFNVLKPEHLLGVIHVTVAVFSFWFSIPAAFPALESPLADPMWTSLKAVSPGKRGLFLAGDFFWFLLIYITHWRFPEESIWKGLPTSRVWEIWPVWSSNSCYFQNGFTQLFENRENHAKI